MSPADYKRSMTGSRGTGMLLATAISLTFATGSALAAKPDGGKGVTCTIGSPQNSPVAVTAGGSVVFQGVVAGGTAPYDVNWTFGGGSPASVNETLSNSGDQTQQHNVSFDTAGTYNGTLAATDSNSRRGR